MMVEGPLSLLMLLAGIGLSIGVYEAVRSIAQRIRMRKEREVMDTWD